MRPSQRSNISECNRSAGMANGKQALVELVLHLREVQLVGVIMVRILNVSCNLYMCCYKTTTRVLHHTHKELQSVRQLRITVRPGWFV